MGSVFRLLPFTLPVLLGFLINSYAVGLRVLTPEEDDGLYRDDPNLPSTPEPMYPDGVNTIPGDAEIHYPVYQKIFKTSFSCSGQVAGFYADIEARCQIWHICDVDGRMQSFLCTNGTIFSQQTRVCEWWYNTNCEANYVKRNYVHNKELYQTFKEAELIRGERKLVPDPKVTGQNSQPFPKAVLQQAPTIPSFPTQMAPVKAIPLGENTRQPPPFRDFSRQDLDGQPKKIEFDTLFQKPRPVQYSRPIEENVRPRQKTEPRRPQQVDEARQAARELQLSREQLEQRRQAARDEFYSIPAKIEQEKRISQQRFQEEQRQKYPSPQPPSPQPTIPAANSQRFQAVIETQRPATAEQEPGSTPHQRFRHSTPRKHNVSFRATTPRQHNNEDEKQIPEETQQNGFPFYNRRFYSRKGFYEIDQRVELGQVGRKVPEPVPTEYFNPYLPTSNAPIEVRPTTTADFQPPEPSAATTTPTTATPKRRTRKRRLRPIKKQDSEIIREIPLPVLSYKPPPMGNPTFPTTTKSPNYNPFRSEGMSRIESVGSSKMPKRMKNGARIVVKRKFRDNFRNTKPAFGNTRNDFPGNPHLVQMVDNEFKQSHATQKRCAVVGTGNTFKVLC